MSDERRSEVRIDEKVMVFIEVCSADFDNNSPANIIICNSIDMSANGVQVEIDQKVPVGTILRICADFGGDEQAALYLVGETKWVKPQQDSLCIGFEIYDAENSDVIGWKKVIAAMLDN
jgi:hypothetical protein